jgi:hypothetical protein
MEQRAGGSQIGPPKPARAVLQVIYFRDAERIRSDARDRGGHGPAIHSCPNIAEATESHYPVDQVPQAPEVVI